MSDVLPTINSSRVWQIGCAKQTIIETRADNFVIGYEVSEDAPCWNAVSLAMRPWKMPLIGGLYLVQRTSTTKGLNDLTIAGGLCLVQRTLTTRVSMIYPLSEDFVSFNGLWPPRVSMICPLLEDFVLCNRLRLLEVSMICPLLEDFVSCNRLWPWRASIICPSSEDFVLYQWWTLTTMGHKIQTGASQGEQRCRRGIKRMYYLDEGGRFCIGYLVNARVITALGCGQRLDPKSLWARSNNDTQQGLGSRVWIW